MGNHADKCTPAHYLIKISLKYTPISLPIHSSLPLTNLKNKLKIKFQLEFIEISPHNPAAYIPPNHHFRGQNTLMTDTRSRDQ